MTALSTRPGGAAGRSGRLSAWAELLRVSALFTVPGDALAGAASLGLRPNRRTALAVGASLCLYTSGMALNDWADREEDAIDRPHRPIPSGRIPPAAALAAAGGLTLAGLALSSRAGRPTLAVATALAATVWSYDLHLKHTAAGPAAMATARALDLLLGATATASGELRPAAGPGRRARRANADPAAAPARPRPDAAPARPRTLAARSNRAGGLGLLRTPGIRGGWVAVSHAALRAAPGRPRSGSVPGAGDPGVLRTPGLWGGWVGVSGAAPGRPRSGSVPATGESGVLRNPSLVGSHAPGAVRAVPAAALLGVHTLAVTAVSRHEAQGGSTAVPLGALAATLALGALVGQGGPGAKPPVSGRGGAGESLRQTPHAPAPATGVAATDVGATGVAAAGVGASGLVAARLVAARLAATGVAATGVAATGVAAAGVGASGLGASGLVAARLAATGLAAAYAATAARPLLHAALNPSPPLTQRAVGGGIRAMIPLQAALAARAGSVGTGAALMALVPLARKLARKVSPT
ncbi:UbiA family prenyltransferase [Streptomyces sp. A3M-1-3]|uniref:UbiA family prenyltransferase n=1 Tax=Streptomyces sp. A3M-1-3 TaxID=2962044 RepID=UPI0020B68535|nr:UbiA family prenyltransferase [Streptomyces sp. A3M-1-3]MCP3822277.1 UbiA family prenyltransferase [Streptomyces sp. A3M-1-3]